jgi:tankyrase
MAASRRTLVHNDISQSHSDPGRELFEACRNGDLNKVKKLVTTHNVNAKDTAGRKSSPLHFAAGKGTGEIRVHSDLFLFINYIIFKISICI